MSAVAADAVVAVAVVAATVVAAVALVAVAADAALLSVSYFLKRLNFLRSRDQK